MKRQKCPICKLDVPASARYPNYVCADCVSGAKAPDGRPLKFINESLSGGFQAFYADTLERYESHVCFIGSISCFADEAYSGGIVIQPAKKDDQET